jgi:hypothetical protein
MPSLASDAEVYPLYSHEREAIDSISLSRLLRLEGLGLVTVVRSKAGLAKRAYLHKQRDDHSRTIDRPFGGTRYSFVENLSAGCRPWSLKRLDGQRGDGRVLVPKDRNGNDDRHVKAVFQRVLLDVLVAASA